MLLIAVERPRVRSPPPAPQGSASKPKRPTAGRPPAASARNGRSSNNLVGIVSQTAREEEVSMEEQQAGGHVRSHLAEEQRAEARWVQNILN